MMRIFNLHLQPNINPSKLHPGSIAVWESQDTVRPGQLLLLYIDAIGLPLKRQ